MLYCYHGFPSVIIIHYSTYLFSHENLNHKYLSNKNKISYTMIVLRVYDYKLSFSNFSTSSLIIRRIFRHQQY